MLSTTATGIAAVMSVYLTVQVSFHGIKHKQRSQVEKPDLAKELDIKLAKMEKKSSLPHVPHIWEYKHFEFKEAASFFSLRTFCSRGGGRSTKGRETSCRTT